MRTASYRAWTPNLGVPVRTSLGAPKWMTAPLVDWPAVMPFGLFGRDLDEATFTRKYRARLHRQGPRILRELAELQAAYDAPLVLLCFERSDAFCHRHVLRAWLQEHGIPVEEVMPPTP